MRKPARANVHRPGNHRRRGHAVRHRPPRQSTAEATLSDREKEILDAVSRGLSNKEIGVALNISENTVASHLKRIYERLHVRSRTEAAMQFSGIK